MMIDALAKRENIFWEVTIGEGAGRDFVIFRREKKKRKKEKRRG